MARTILQGFQELRSRLEITEPQEIIVSKRQQNVRDAVANELSVVDHFLAGSYKRKTMIAPLSKADIDIFCVLSSNLFADYRDGGQAAFLDRVKRVLQRA